jgi:hypothetical protein
VAYKDDQLYRFYCNYVFLVHVYVLTSLLIGGSLRNKKNLIWNTSGTSHVPASPSACCRGPETKPSGGFSWTQVHMYFKNCRSSVNFVKIWSVTVIQQYILHLVIMLVFIIIIWYNKGMSNLKIVISSQPRKVYKSHIKRKTHILHILYLSEWNLE